VQLGCVDVYQHLATHPGAIDAWRLFLYLESIDVARVDLDGAMYEVEYRPLERLLQELEAEGTLRRVIWPGGSCWHVATA